MKTAWAQTCRIPPNVAWILADNLGVNIQQIITTHTQKKVLEKITDFWENGYNCFLNLEKRETINLVLPRRRIAA